VTTALPPLPSKAALGLRALALDASAEGPWTSEQFDPQFVLGWRLRELEALLHYGRIIVRTSDEDMKRQLHGWLIESRTALKAAFANWQPTESERRRPH
jgi:hypothetical protein